MGRDAWGMEWSRPLMPVMAPSAGRTRWDNTACGRPRRGHSDGCRHRGHAQRARGAALDAADYPCHGQPDARGLERTRRLGRVCGLSAPRGASAFRYDGYQYGLPGQPWWRSRGVARSTPPAGLHRRSAQSTARPAAAGPDERPQIRYLGPKCRGRLGLLSQRGCKESDWIHGNKQRLHRQQRCAHTGWQDARAPATDKSLTKLRAALSQQMRYVSTGQGNGEAKAIFDDVGGGEHGSNHTTLLPRKARRLSTGASGACHARLQSKVGAIFILGTIVASKKHGTNNHE